MKPILSGAALLTMLFSAQANAAAPNVQFGSDTRAMSNADCLSRAKFAMGEQHLQICATDGSDVAGCGGSVTSWSPAFQWARERSFPSSPQAQTRILPDAFATP